MTSKLGGAGHSETILQCWKSALLIASVIIPCLFPSGPSLLISLRVGHDSRFECRGVALGQFGRRG
jgi:hypothetical protein